MSGLTVKRVYHTLPLTPRLVKPAKAAASCFFAASATYPTILTKTPRAGGLENAGPKTLRKSVSTSRLDVDAEASHICFRSQGQRATQMRH